MEVGTFECPICFYEKDPCMLPCGHNACGDCIKSLKTPKQCHECRSLVPNEYKICKNFLLIKALKLIKELIQQQAEAPEIFWENFITSKILLANIHNANWNFPTPIQKKVIPKIMTYKNLLIESPNGSGKTGSFVLGSLLGVYSYLNKIQVISISHTKEIKDMHFSIFQQMAVNMNISVYKTEKNIIPANGGAGIHVLCGTLDSVKNFIARYSRGLDDVCIIVDECDEILANNMGHFKMFEFLNKFTKKQVLLYSATLSQITLDFNTQNKLGYEIVSEQGPETLNERTSVFNYFVKKGTKAEFILDKLKFIQFSLCIIFVNTRDSAYFLAELAKKGYKAEFFSAELDHYDREVILSMVNEGKINVLVSTDLLGRGFDCKSVDLVINFECPLNPLKRSEPNYTAFFHRCGRTSRNNRPGTLINLIDPKDATVYMKVLSHYKITQKYESDFSLDRVIKSIEQNSNEYQKFI